MRKDIYAKIQVLSDSAKYDVSCSSSGSESNYKTGELGTTESSGICHAFIADDRRVSLLNALLTNYCLHDCAYCIAIFCLRFVELEDGSLYAKLESRFNLA